MVVDTSVVSLIFNQHSLAASFEKTLYGKQLIVSFMTLAEIEFGMQSAAWGQARRDLMYLHLKNYAILYPTAELCRLWGAVFDESKRKGKPIGHADTWIAATALYLDVPLITHNTRHFLHIDRLRLI